MQVAWLNDQQPLLVMFLADGAGSVSQGGEGATLAVNEAMAYMSQKVQGGELGLNDILATDYSAAIFLIPICISFDTAEKRRYATYLILNRRFSFEF